MKNTTKGKPVSLEIEGTLKGQRFLIRVNGVDVWLPPKSFKYIATLAVASFYPPDGWISRFAFEAGDNSYKYLHRMKREVLAPLDNLEWPVYQTDKKRGRVRLAIDERLIEIRYENLAKNDDQEVRKLAIHEVGKYENL